MEAVSKKNRGFNRDEGDERDGKKLEPESFYVVIASHFLSEAISGKSLNAEDRRENQKQPRATCRVEVWRTKTEDAKMQR